MERTSHGQSTSWPGVPRIVLVAGRLRGAAARLGSHDVSARFGGSMPRAAAAVRARMLVVWSPDDQLVDPRPAAAFARLVRTDTLAVPSHCGHSVFWCEPARIGRAVRAIIARAPRGAPTAAAAGRR